MSIVIPVFMLGLLTVLGQIDFEAKGPTGLVHPRPVALHLLVIVALAVAQWRYGVRSKDRRWGAIVCIVAVVTIILTLSRMASLTAVLLVATFRLNPVKPWNLIPQVLLGLAVFGFILFQVPWFRERSFFKEDVSITESWRHVNTAGRADSFWPMTIEHALQKPLFGWGLGGARIYLGQFGRKVEGKWEPTDYHPHNEYLQVFHDMGLLGLLLMLLTWGALVRRCWQDWQRAHLAGDRWVAKWSMAATMAMAAVLFTILTDNTLHFASVMTPVFIIVACAEALKWISRPGSPAVLPLKPRLQREGVAVAVA
jgi:O-antigen ligase